MLSAETDSSAEGGQALSIRDHAKLGRFVVLMDTKITGTASVPIQSWPSAQAGYSYT